VSSLSPLPARPMCVWREKECWSCTHISLSLTTHTSCCSITGRWILFIMALRSCFLLHSIGLARKPAYVLSSRNDRLLFVQDYTHAYRRLTGRSFVFFFINYISTFHFALPYIYSPKKMYLCFAWPHIYSLCDQSYSKF